MEQNTTPAPWLVNDKDYDRFGKTVWVESKDGNFVCELVRDGEHREHANARLIAAAPELFEAAQKALDDCVDLIGTEAGIALENAIAKAKGES